MTSECPKFLLALQNKPKKFWFAESVSRRREINFSVVPKCVPKSKQERLSASRPQCTFQCDRPVGQPCGVGVSRPWPPPQRQQQPRWWQADPNSPRGLKTRLLHQSWLETGRPTWTTWVHAPSCTAMQATCCFIPFPETRQQLCPSINPLKVFFFFFSKKKTTWQIKILSQSCWISFRLSASNDPCISRSMKRPDWFLHFSISKLKTLHIYCPRRHTYRVIVAFCFQT